MSVIAPKYLRTMKDLIACVMAGEGRVDQRDLEDCLDAIDRSLQPKRSLAPARDRRETKAEEFQSRRAAIRAEVVARAGGLCEACLQPLRPEDPGELDEFFGGSGRRRQLMAVDTCWLLGHTCHQDKSANRPDAKHWIGLFVTHCGRHGYAEAAALASRRLA